MNKKITTTYILLATAIVFCALGVFLLIAQLYVAAILTLIPICFALVFAFFSFSDYTKNYLLKNRVGFDIMPFKEPPVVLTAKEKEFGIWVVSDGAREITFDLIGYKFPVEYICAYFVKNINFKVVKKNHLKFFKTFYSLRIKNLNVCENCVLQFERKGKRQEKQLIKNKKTKVTFLRHLIMQSGYAGYALRDIYTEREMERELDRKNIL